MQGLHLILVVARVRNRRFTCDNHRAFPKSGLQQPREQDTESQLCRFLWIPYPRGPESVRSLLSVREFAIETAK